MKPILVSSALLAACTFALAKIPAPVMDDAAKAKAAEAAAKTAWQAKVDAYQLCKAQDKVVASYHKTSGKAVPEAPKPAAKPAAAASKPASAASMAKGAASAPSGTPVTSSVPPPCGDPGPFAYNPPSQTPLETSGAHSPAGNATKPPSNNQESAKLAPAK